MAARLHVLAPGLATTIQDLGRFGYQDQGVPPAGALDRVGLRLANALAGNPPATAGLELRYLGPTLRVEGGPARVAVAGPVRLSLQGGGVLEPDRSHVLEPGSVLAVGSLMGVSTAYLAVEGGFDLPPVLGSLSTYARAALGPLGGGALKAGMILPLVLDRCRPGAPKALARPFDYGKGPIRVVAGPQEEYFTATAWRTLLSASYGVGREADRMGLRLEGPPLEHVAGADIASDGLACGCIQVPGNGQPIIVLADRQTVGGYAKIATVISADLPRLGRLVPGDSITFALVTVAEAEEARRRLEAQLRQACGSLVLAGMGGLDLGALYGAELISGMVDAVSGEGK